MGARRTDVHIPDSDVVVEIQHSRIRGEEVDARGADRAQTTRREARAAGVMRGADLTAAIRNGEMGLKHGRDGGHMLRGDALWDVAAILQLPPSRGSRASAAAAPRRR